MDKQLVQRTPISSLLRNFDCPLSYTETDCRGNCFLTMNEEKGKYRHFHVNVGFTLEDFDRLETLIWICESDKKLVRLTTDIELPKELLWAVSFNAKNILQINVDMLQFKRNFDWIRRTAHLSNNCGLYNVYCIHSIVPTVVKTYDVLELMDALRNTGYHHFTLKFPQFEIQRKPKDYFNFEGHLVPAKYVTKVRKDHIWSCTQEFIENFVAILNEYIIPRSVSMTVCGTNKDCTGLNR